MEQLTFDQVVNKEAFIPLAHGGWVRHIPSFYPGAFADKIYKTLLHDVPWQYTGYDRLTKWYDFLADADHMPRVLYRMRDDTEVFTFRGPGNRFRGVFLNLYRNGRDHVGFHRDEENEDSPIASVSFGAARRFCLHYVGTAPLRPGEIGTLEFRLVHGSCLIMGGAIQQFWKHGIPREAAIKAPRINLTFRE